MAAKIAETNIPQLRDLVVCLKDVDWHQLGTQLKVPSDKLKQIGEEYHGPRKLNEVLSYWLNNDKEATWETVLKALKRIGCHKSLVSHLWTKYCIPQESLEHVHHSILRQDSRAYAKSRLSEAEREDFEHQILLDLKRIRFKFSKLQSALRESLTQKKVKAKQIVALVIGYGVFKDQLQDKDESLLKSSEEKLKSATSIEDVFIELSNYWSCIEYDILTIIIDEYGDDDDQKMIEEYTNAVKAFFQNRKVSEVPRDSKFTSCHSSGETHERVIIKLNLDNPHLKTVTNMKSKVCEILGVKPSVLLIEEIKEGCVEVILLVPKHLVKLIFGDHLTEVLYKEQLSAASVIFLSGRDISFCFTPQETSASSNQDTSTMHEVIGDIESSLQSHPQLQEPKLNSDQLTPIAAIETVGGLESTGAQILAAISEPGRNARVHRPKVASRRLSPTRLSLIQPRKYDLSKTLSMGAALDSTSGGQVLWKPVESTGQRISSIAVGTSLGVESMQQEASGGGSDDSPSTTPSTSPRSMGGSSPVVSTAAGFRMPFVTQMPTQEQLEALYKTIPASQDQLEAVQKQMMAFLEQQQKAATALGLVTSSAGGGAASTVAPPTTENQVFPFPLVFALGVPATAAPSPLTQMQTSSGTSNATPSPTPSNSSTDSGISGISLMSGFSGFPQTTGLSTGTATLGARQCRPLSESLSASGFQQQQQQGSGSPGVGGAMSADITQQYKTLLKQFNLQNQQLLLQGHQVQQHYLEQQQRLVQQALLERKHFEDQQRQLAAMHLRQQQELQKKQQVLRQMQEAQVATLQRQQLLLYQQSLQQQQRLKTISEISPLTAEPEKFEITIDYSIKLGAEKQVRKYQHELAEPGINGENCIIVAPTGSGKTLVAALVISDHLQKNQHNDDKPTILFIVNTRPLAEQQKREIKQFIPNARVECSMGDGGPTVADLLTDTDVIVCTTGKLLDSIKGGKVTFDRISLIVMDECHHTKKESSQANIMRRYLEHKVEGTSKIPQVIGLTASPGVGENPDLDEKKTIDHLINLCAHMDATRGIVTVKKHQEELDRCTNKPSFTLEVLQQRDSQEPFIQMIIREMESLEQHVPFVKSALLKWSPEYETKIQQEKAPLELSTNPKFRDQISTLCLLRCYSQAMNIYMDLRSDDAISVLQGYDGLPSDDSQATVHERNLKKALQQMVVSLGRLPQTENPLLNAAEEKLASVFEHKRDLKGIFFVPTKVHAQSICKWIESLPIASKYSIHPLVLTGHTRDTGTGMTQVAQQEVMDSFHSGECNLLVATSVAEEGLDVPACNLVIRFQHISNEIARVQTHGRARADESEGFTILSCDTKKKFQEMKNEMRLRLMESCIQWFPTGEHLVRKIKEQQNDIISRHKRKLALRKQLSSKQDSNNFQLKCKKCKVLACSGSDVFLIEDASNHHMVTNKEFRTKKIIIRPHDQPRLLSQTAEIAKTHKIYCANCNANWGIMVTWPTKGHQFPVLKCKSFIFVAKGIPQPVTKWSDAPFKVSVWMDLQDQDEESSSDNQ